MALIGQQAPVSWHIWVKPEQRRVLSRGRAGESGVLKQLHGRYDLGDARQLVSQHDRHREGWRPVGGKSLELAAKRGQVPVLISRTALDQGGRGAVSLEGKHFHCPKGTVVELRLVIRVGRGPRESIDVVNASGLGGQNQLLKVAAG